ncbi:unnamed protein product [Pieris macdunnoughi]|uniref:Uncharacterized protein n=1 Tax=Pieris macdunnoughi TaxID=345717 RepID=A0A821VQI3_9NEOP|nr:unnamed protein product [Pieris macdunnoughi]
MSNLCSRIVLKPVKRLPNGTDLLVDETNTWMNAENVNNGGGLSVSPPNTISQRELTTLVSHCYNVPTSPCSSKSSTPSPTALPTTPPRHSYP